MGFDTDTRIDLISDWASIFPSPMDGWISSALSGFEDLLFDLSGDPGVLSTLHGVWTADQAIPRDLAIEQSTHRGSLLPSWDAASRSAFDANMAALEVELPFLGENFGAIAELLKEAGEAAVATVNAIVDLILALLAWALAEAFVAIASAVITLGTSVAAWFGSQAVKFGIATARVSAMIVRLEGILISILAAIGSAVEAITLARTASVMAALIAKAVPEVVQATGAAGDL